MGLYAQGRTSALATIKSAVNSRITTLADGSQSLDWPSLQNWLMEQGNLIVSADVVLANQPAARGVMSTLNSEPDARKLAAFINKSNWESRADWPTNLSVSSGQSFIGSVAAAVTDMNRLADTIESHYVSLGDDMARHVDNVCAELGVEANLPDVKVRIVDTRFYVFTYVTDWGEESAPSPVTDVIELDQDDTVLVTRTDTVPVGRNVVGWRLYRSNVGSQAAAFQLVVDMTAPGAVVTDGAFDYFAIATTTYTDDQKAEELQEILPSTTWLEPPANLAGLVGMPNGVMAGYFNNTVCFCEPYYPYAWPVEYQMTVEYPVTAMACFGQTLVVAHQGGINYISGADSASMSMQKDVSLQTCASSRSMVTVEGGVMFASPDGLCLADGSGVKVLTEGRHFTREDWQKLKPESMVGAYHEHTYYFLYDTGTAAGCHALHLGTAKLTELTLSGSAFYTDKRTDRLYVAQGTNIVACFAGNTYRTGVWRSKVSVMPAQTGFAWLTVESDFSAPVTVRWYGDGALVHTATVNSRTPVRLPVGRYLEHEIEVESAARWNSLTMASSTAELQGV
jgi:hypothetical protein